MLKFNLNARKNYKGARAKEYANGDLMHTKKRMRAFEARTNR